MLGLAGARRLEVTVAAKQGRWAMIFRNSQSAKVFFLSEQGSPQNLDRTHDVAPRADAICILGRGLCRYHFFEAPIGVRGGAAEKAVRLYAESHGPFPRSDFAIFRAVSGYSIWWWDAEALRARECGGWLYDPERVAPEAVLQPVGEGLRLLETSDGFEAQYWMSATLIASTWRRRAFSADQWAAFVRNLGPAVASASTEPPSIEAHDWILANLRALKRIKSPKAAQRLEQIAAASLLVMAAASVGIGARTIHLGAQADAQEAILAEFKARHASPEDASAVADRAFLEFFAERSARSNALFAVSQFHKVVQAFGIPPGAVTADDASLRGEIVLGPGQSLENVARGLEDSPWFQDVRPETDPSTGKVIVTARICNAALDKTCIGDTGGPNQ